MSAERFLLISLAIKKFSELRETNDRVSSLTVVTIRSHYVI